MFPSVKIFKEKQHRVKRFIKHNKLFSKKDSGIVHAKHNFRFSFRKKQGLLGLLLKIVKKM